MKDTTRLVLLALLVSMLGASGTLRAQNPLPSAPRPIPVRDLPAPGASAPTPTAATATLPTAQDSAPAPAAPTGGQPVISAGGDYVLAASDTIEMSIFQEPGLTTQVRIASDGSAQFPFIGEVKVAGMAMRDARELIRKRYNADYLVEPQVYLRVLGYATRKFTVLGQVARPGTFEFPPGEHLTLLEAVGMAGGFTRLAKQDSVKIRRETGGAGQTLKVNAKKARDGKSFELVAGDVITVDETWF